MDFEKLPTFEECLNECQHNKHLLLGNGFSIAACSNFNYKSLKDAAQKRLRSYLINDNLDDFFNNQDKHFESLLQESIERKRLYNQIHSLEKNLKWVLEEDQGNQLIKKYIEPQEKNFTEKTRGYFQYFTDMLTNSELRTEDYQKIQELLSKH